ncbi:MAG: RtcB family protein [Anaerolineaceae bacterium]|nr:MAG: RtcB family protein [Anaerolineaceae bacterium]
MKYIESEDGILIKSWCNELEEGAIKQARKLARLPFARMQICLMPDTHEGYGMPIGGILATEGVIIPYAVGVDIGCGMTAMRTSLTEITTDQIKAVLGGSKENKGGIRAAIPVGFGKHSKRQDEGLMPETARLAWLTEKSIVHREWGNALHSLGTLGGGNHFIEIQKGSDGHIWVMLHSGSRNLGKKVCDHYNKIAVDLNQKWHTSVPKNWQLAFLPLDTDEGQAYLAEMKYCVDFAQASRELMMGRIGAAFIEALGGKVSFGDDTYYGITVNIAHNYARMENHFGKNVMIHRKGATSARDGEIGIIPGSQGTSSYIVRGKGCKDSFESCSHGAGRKMSRTRAENELNLEEEKKRMDDQGIIHGIRTAKDLDEAPGSYKDIDVVMAEQADLVGIMVKLTPLAVVKG